MIEYEITDQKRKSFLRSFSVKGLFLTTPIVIFALIRFGFVWGGLLMGTTILSLLVYEIYLYVKKDSYKIQIDDKGITKISSTKQQKVLFVDIKENIYIPSSQNYVSLKINPHNFFAVPFFSFMVPDEYVEKVKAVLPPPKSVT